MYRFKLKLLYLFCCLLVGSGLAAQDASYFVYIQHEKQQPFYVKLEGKMLSSSVKGYVILPKLPQGKVPVTIGFPKSEAPEQSYVLRLTGQRDYGFLLKNTGEKEYALYDLQTFATLKSGGGAPAALQENVTVTRISGEGSTAEQKELINNVQADVETALAAKKPDTVPKKKGSFAEALDRVVTDDRPEDMPLEAPKPKPVVVAAPIEPDVVPAAEAPPVKKPRGKKNRKEREALSEEEQNLLSSVMEDEKKAAADEAVAAVPAMVDSVSATMVDSVRGGEEVPVPVAKKERKAKKKKEQAEPEFIDFDSTTKPAAAAPVAEKVADVVPEEETPSQPEVSAKEAREAKRLKRKAEREAAERAAFVKDSIANVEFNSTTPVEPAVEEKKPAIKMVNSDCEKILEVDAFRKLLRTMNSKKSDDDMVDAFRKGTRSVCISTEQIRALTQLISTEESRYQLLDAAYARTYDTQNFSTLADLLKEDYYKGRFKAMIKK